MSLRKHFDHDGLYAMYLREERKLIQEERGRIRRTAAVSELGYWRNILEMCIFLFTPKYVWSQFVAIKNNSLN